MRDGRSYDLARGYYAGPTVQSEHQYFISRLGPLNSQFSHITNIVCESRKLLKVILLGYFKCLGLQVSRAFFEPDVGPVRPLAWHTRGSYDLVHPQTQS